MKSTERYRSTVEHDGGVVDSNIDMETRGLLNFHSRRHVNLALHKCRVPSPTQFRGYLNCKDGHPVHQQQEQQQYDMAAAPTQPDPPEDAEPVFTSKDIVRFLSLGLGRGIDATNPDPWLNKSSFQVRQVHEQNIIGTEEGGAMHSYEREVKSVHNLQAAMKSSIVIPKSPITLGTDAELSHRIGTSRRIIGRRVVNCSVAFLDDFVDVPLPEETALTFEERLAQWLVQSVNAYRLKVKALESLDADKNPLESLAQIIDQGNQSELKILVDGCQEFVDHFRITHYVSSIDLGAAEYHVLTEQEYFSKVGLSGSFGVEKVIDTGFSGTTSLQKSIKASNVRKIGIIDDDDKTVARGTYGEAVVGFKIQPLTNLIQQEFLKLALKKALIHYFDAQIDVSATDGPFKISCANEKLFLKVDPDTQRVHAVRDIQQASNFFIDPTDEGQNRYEFHIIHYRESELDQFKPIGNYLSAPLSTFGKNPGPLQMRANGSHEKCRFALHPRLIQRKTSATASDLTTWTSGKEVFYVNCSRRRFKKDGYLCVKRNRPESFITACVSSPDYHDDTKTFMLFRLLPVSACPLGQSADEASAEERELSKLDRLIEENEQSTEAAHKESAQKLATANAHATERYAGFSMMPIKND